MAARTGQGNTKLRSLRVPEEIWAAAVSRARAEGTTVTALVVALLKDYVAKR